jgi:hypothetical protein
LGRESKLLDVFFLPYLVTYPPPRGSSNTCTKLLAFPMAIENQQSFNDPPFPSNISSGNFSLASFWVLVVHLLYISKFPAPLFMFRFFGGLPLFFGAEFVGYKSIRFYPMSLEELIYTLTILPSCSFVNRAFFGGLSISCGTSVSSYKADSLASF